MQIKDLKNSMSALEEVLAKTSSEIRIDVGASESAQGRILGRFRQSAVSAGIIALVFTSLWIGNANPEGLPMLIKAFLSIYCAVAAGWYVFLYYRLRKIDISMLKPVQLFSQVSVLKIMVLSGEIVFGIGLAVFFTLLVSERIISGTVVLFLFFGVLAMALSLGIFYFWPQYARLFRALTSLK